MPCCCGFEISEMDVEIPTSNSSTHTTTAGNCEQDMQLSNFDGLSIEDEDEIVVIDVDEDDSDIEVLEDRTCNGAIVAAGHKISSTNTSSLIVSTTVKDTTATTAAGSNIRSLTNEDKSSQPSRNDKLLYHTVDDGDSEAENGDDSDKGTEVHQEEMICVRCTDEKMGKFKDAKLYWVHVKRHTMPDTFACPNCQRPFTCLSQCLSHEIRVHQTLLPEEVQDPDILTAIEYVRTEQDGSRKGVEEDCGNVRSGKINFVCSTPLYPYMGPEIKHRMEAYAVQLLYGNLKAESANFMAQDAIATHQENVEAGMEENGLGRFSSEIALASSPKEASRESRSTSPLPSTSSGLKGNGVPLATFLSTYAIGDKGRKTKKKGLIALSEYNSSSSDEANCSSSSSDSDWMPDENE